MGPLVTQEPPKTRPDQLVRNLLTGDRYQPIGTKLDLGTGHYPGQDRVLNF